MPRTIWKGAVSFGLVHIPMALVPATTRSGIDFDWLDKRSMDRVGYKRINKTTGEVKVTRICLAHDCGEMVNPDGVANQVEGGVLQTVSRTLMETVKWDREKVLSVDWATYPIMRFHDVPKVEVVLIDRPTEQPWGAGEPTPTAIPAAVANAIFDATGARLRSVPITPEKVKAAMAQGPARA